MNNTKYLASSIFSTLVQNNYDKELNIYRDVYFKVNNTMYYIDGASWEIYRVTGDELITVKRTVSIDKPSYLITTVGGIPVKLHRVIAMAVLGDGHKLVEEPELYNTNHMLIPSTYFDLNIVNYINSPRYIEVITVEENYEHRRFIKSNCLFNVPVSYNDIPFFERYFRDNKIPYEDRAKAVKQCYNKRRDKIEEFMPLHNIFKP